MDAKSQQMETQLQLLKKEQSAAEDFCKIYNDNKMNKSG